MILKNAVKFKCRPLHLFNLVSGLTADQRAAVQDIGFGGLLHLKVNRVPKDIVPKLLSSFNEWSFMFHTSSCNFLLRKEDVHDCFLIPMGPKELPILGTRSSTTALEESCIALKVRWRKIFGVEGSSNAILIGKLYNKLVRLKECKDDFKRMFVLYSMSAFLAPMTNSTVDLKLLSAVEDVSEIRQLDWCSYVFQNLVKACADTKKKPTFIGGCIVFLMIAYFHRFDFQGAAAPTTLPLIQHWDYEQLKTRADAKMESGILGDAVLSKKRMTSDLHDEDSLKLISFISRKRKSSLKIKEKPEKRKSTRVDTRSVVLDEDEIQEPAADDLQELLMALKRETEVFHGRYTYLVSEVKKRISMYAPNESANPAEGPFTPTQSFFADPELHRYVDEVVEIAKAMKASNERCPSFDKLSQRSTPLPSDKGTVGGVVGNTSAEKGQRSPYTCELGAEGGVNETDADALVCSVLGDLGRDFVGDNDGDTGFFKEAINEDINDVTYILTHSSLHYPYLLHSKKLLSCTVVVPDDLGCTCDCGGGPDPNMVVVSKFLLSNRDILSPI
ncbi:hypothetical protein RND81_02G208300 [Saponaria officinalis]|uniref:Aminotransferase-like plant mobile domain-containing protein n=1 Tax=Saponaria officinalis TaxID=3572 RepID=A0AAW1MW48_SAPOF